MKKEIEGEKVVCVDSEFSNFLEVVDPVLREAFKSLHNTFVTQSKTGQHEAFIALGCTLPEPIGEKKTALLTIPNSEEIISHPRYLQFIAEFLFPRMVEHVKKEYNTVVDHLVLCTDVRLAKMKNEQEANELSETIDSRDKASKVLRELKNSIDAIMISFETKDYIFLETYHKLYLEDDDREGPFVLSEKPVSSSYVKREKGEQESFGYAIFND